MARPRGLGKGLGSLIPEKTVIENQPIAATPKDGVLEVPVENISANPRQPRRHFEPNALDTLAASIKEYGIVQPLIVSEGDGETYELLAGERRLRASKMIGLETVPVLIRTVSEQEKLEIALLENVQREDLNPIEEAIAYKRLMDEFGLTQAQVARRVMRGRASVANMLRLLLLSKEMQEALKEKKMSEGHAKVLLSVADEKMRQVLFDRILQEGLSVRGLERVVKGDEEGTGTKQPTSKGEVSTKLNPALQQAEDAVRQSLGAPVRIKPGKRGGKLQITYFSDEELERILGRLL